MVDQARKVRDATERLIADLSEQLHNSISVVDDRRRNPAGDRRRTNRRRSLRTSCS
jgi:hypothetical protein